jgi:nicotinamidase-related amidase
MNATTLQRPAQVPGFFDPANAGRWDYRPEQSRIFDEAMQAASSLRPAASDRKRLDFLGIDLQKDFGLKEGSLFVGGRSGTGAIEDSARIARWIYDNLSVITNIRLTLDTHRPFQIFSRSFWVKADDSPIDAFTFVTADEIRQGVYRPRPAAAHVAANGNYAWLLKQVIDYCEQLERAGKYKLYIWPEHCLLGTAGHNLIGVIEEAALYHSWARGSQGDFQIKGTNPLTENYSVLRPEVLVRHDGKPLAQKNVSFIETLLAADYVVIGGQAASHCVKSSIDDFLDEILAKDPTLAQKVYVVEDFMSSVTVPDGQGGFFADFTPEAQAALAKFANAGMHVVKSTDPVDTWPDLVL